MKRTKGGFYMGGISQALSNLEKSAANTVDNIGNTISQDLSGNKQTAPPVQTQNSNPPAQNQTATATLPPPSTTAQDKSSILSKAESTLTNFGHSAAGALGIGKTSTDAAATAAVAGAAVAGPVGAAAAGGVTAAVVGGASLAANQQDKQGADATAGSIIKNDLVSAGTGIANDLGFDKTSTFTKQGYPPIYGGTQAQASQIWGYMQNMPPADRQAVHSVHVGSAYTTGAFQTVAKGSNGQEQNFGDIYLNTKDLETRGQYVVLHESGHAVELHNGTLQGPTASIWNGPDVYGNPVTNHPGETVNPPSETFADSYAAYYGGNGAALKATSSAEYNAIKSGAYASGGPSQVTTGDQILSGVTNIGEGVSSLFGGLGGGIASGVNNLLANIGFGLGGVIAPGLNNVAGAPVITTGANAPPIVGGWGGG